MHPAHLLPTELDNSDQLPSPLINLQFEHSSTHLGNNSSDLSHSTQWHFHPTESLVATQNPQHSNRQTIPLFSPLTFNNPSPPSPSYEEHHSNIQRVTHHNNCQNFPSSFASYKPSSPTLLVTDQEQPQHSNVFENPFMLLPSRDVKQPAVNSNPHCQEPSPHLLLHPTAAANFPAHANNTSRFAHANDIDLRVSVQNRSIMKNEKRHASHHKVRPTTHRMRSSQHHMQNRICPTREMNSFNTVMLNHSTGTLMHRNGTNGLPRGVSEPLVIGNVKTEPILQHPNNAPSSEKLLGPWLTWEQFCLAQFPRVRNPNNQDSSQISQGAVLHDGPITDYEMSHGALPSYNPTPQSSNLESNQTMRKMNSKSVVEEKKEVKKRQKKHQNVEVGLCSEDDAPIAQWPRMKHNGDRENKEDTVGKKRKAEEMRERRARRNRESARRSRMKSKEQFQNLEKQYVDLHNENAALSNFVEKIVVPSLASHANHTLDTFTTAEHR